MKTSKLPANNTMEMAENMLEVTDTSAAMNLPKKRKQVIAVSKEAINSAHYVYIPDLRDLGKLYKVAVGQEQAV